MRGRTETCSTPVIFYAITSFASLPREPQCFKRLLMRTSLRRHDTGYTGIDRSWSRFTQHFSFDWRHAWPLQIRALTLGMRGFCSIFVDAIPWENNRHFLKPSLVSTQNVVWATTEEIPYCWRVTYQIWALLTGWSKLSPWHNQSEALPKPLMRHHYGISGALSSDVILGGETRGGVAKGQLFSQVIFLLLSLSLFSFLGIFTFVWGFPRV